MNDQDRKRMISVMKGYERKSKLPHYDMWSKSGSSYKFKMNELNYVTIECPKASQADTLSLDAGCGFGIYSFMLLSKGYFVVGMDVSVGMLRKARNLIKRDKIYFVRGSLTHLPFKSFVFNLILCVDTLHHLTDSFFDTTLQEFKRTIRNQGMLITDTRNALNPLVRIRYMIEDAKWAETGGLTLKARNPKYVNKKLRDYGFTTVKTKGIGFVIQLLAPYIVIVSRAIDERSK